jgi:hypothetical protein
LGGLGRISMQLVGRLLRPDAPNSCQQQTQSTNDKTCHRCSLQHAITAAPTPIWGETKEESWSFWVVQQQGATAH